MGAGREMTSDGKPFVAFNNSARCVQKAGLPKTQHSALDPLKHAISRRRDRPPLRRHPRRRLPRSALRDRREETPHFVQRHL